MLIFEEAPDANPEGPRAITGRIDVATTEAQSAGERSIGVRRRTPIVAVATPTVERTRFAKASEQELRNSSVWTNVIIEGRGIL